MKCSHCQTENTKKNGHTHYGKQNYYCHSCNRQFVERGKDWFVKASDKVLIGKLLLERIRYQVSVVCVMSFLGR